MGGNKLFSVVEGIFTRQYPFTEGKPDYFSQYIVACHLSKGSLFRWREDMSGGLTNVD